MLSTLMVVLPIFALIFVGWLARRLRVCGPNTTVELNRYVVYLALPAMLFDIIAHVRWHDIWLPGFILAFGGSSAVVFLLVLFARWRRPLHLADAALDGLNAGYANVGFVGFPLALMALGPAAMPATAVAAIITVCVVFALAIVLIEVGLQTERSGLRVAWKVTRSLARNPLMVSPCLGALVPMFGAAIPAPVETFLKLLGGSASPCALVALGLFLAASPMPGLRQLPSFSLLVGSKLLLHPLLAWLLAAPLLHLPPVQVHTAVLMSALPTGTGPFMLAEFYRREARTTSNAVLFSTILSVLTVSAYLAWAL